MLEWIQSNQFGRNEMLYRDKTVSKVRNWLSLGCRIYWINATIERDTVIYDFDQIKTCLDIYGEEFLELWEMNLDWYLSSQTYSKCKILTNDWFEEYSYDFWLKKLLLLPSIMFYFEPYLFYSFNKNIPPHIYIIFFNHMFVRISDGLRLRFKLFWFVSRVFLFSMCVYFQLSVCNNSYTEKVVANPPHTVAVHRVY